MRIRVVDRQRWNRSKRLAQGWLSFAMFVVATGFAGGLEGTEEPPSAFWAFFFIGVGMILIPRRQISSTKKEGAIR